MDENKCLLERVMRGSSESSKGGTTLALTNKAVGNTDIVKGQELTLVVVIVPDMCVNKMVVLMGWEKSHDFHARHTTGSLSGL